MGIEIGNYIFVKTKTFNNSFGDCIYEIVGPFIEKECKKLVKCVMLGGSGESAKKGLIVWDEIENINNNIKSKVIRIINKEEAEKVSNCFNNKSNPLNGVLEI